jgi:cell wall-associated NlpC family hydrolase
MATKTAPTGAEVVADAQRYLGIPYVFGGGPANPKAGLDCSGLTSRVGLDLGVTSIPRTSEAQFAWCKKESGPGPGFLVFFLGAPEQAGPPGHVGIVVSPGVMINAPHRGTVVQQDNYSENGTGYSKFMGYGSMQGVTGSATANTSLASNVSGGVNEKIAGGVAGFVGTLVAMVLLVVIVAALIFGAYLLFKGANA